MRKSVMAGIVLIALAPALNASTPRIAEKPFGLWLVSSCAPCIPAADVTLRLVIPPPPPTPPPVCCPFPTPIPTYTLQATDVITWSFGDGTSFTETGNSETHHAYATNGIYSLSAVVANSDGSETFHATAVIAPNTSTRVDFAQSVYTVAESGGYVDVQLLRSGDISIPSRVLFSTEFGGYPPPGEPPFMEHVAVFAQPALFMPGEKSKTIRVAIEDDDLFGGDQYPWIFLTTLDGTPVGLFGQIHVVEDDPPPVARIEDATAREASGALTFTIHLDKPAGRYTQFICDVTPGTAREGIDYAATGFMPSIFAGEQSTTFTLPILDNARVEHDKTVNVTVRSFFAVTFDRNRASGTIVDDDFEIAPAKSELIAGESKTLRLNIGEPFLVATDVPLESSDPSVLGVPATLRFAAGATTAEFTITAKRAGKVAIFARMPESRGSAYVRADATVAAPTRRRGASH
jgi:uncharacterized cupredoxin-like copper-binding protein